LGGGAPGEREGGREGERRREGEDERGGAGSPGMPQFRVGKPN